MDKRLYELLEECVSIIRESFPDYTHFNIHCCNNGYRSITITKWEDEDKKEVAQQKRRELFNQTKSSDAYDWESDQSQMINKYYKELGVLLPECSSM